VSAQQADDRGAPTCLIVEDTDELREILVDAFRDDGFRVLEAASVSSAFQHLSAARSVDLVVTDFSLEDGDGLSMVTRARHEGLLDGAPVILCTGQEDVCAPAPILVLRKPISPDRVLAAARRLLAPSRSSARLRRARSWCAR
jgi:DNA-binding NtrC family response regulator